MRSPPRWLGLRWLGRRSDNGRRWGSAGGEEEDGGKNKEYREKYDIACARAVANLPVLCEYCIPFVKLGGQFVAMKGSAAKEELALSGNAYKILGCEKPTIICGNLRENEPRAFIISKKISQTPPKYPRMGGKIAKSAL